MDIVARLRQPKTIRARCQQIFAAGVADQLEHFALDLSQLDRVADYVIAVMRENYPDLSIPYHSRWRHFDVGGRDRWAELAAALTVSAQEKARIRTELAIVSVLLDAGAGEHWSYQEAASGQVYRRSEGLAVASFTMYQEGLFSGEETKPLQVDGIGLHTLGEATLAQAFQVGPDNPLIGVNGRVSLLRQLCLVLQQQTEIFTEQQRLGLLFDHLEGQAKNAAGQLPAAAILKTILETLSPIWPGRITIEGTNLGDVGRHCTVQADDLSNGLVPFHKLSQWLSYSLLEPLAEAGIEVTGLDALTGLPEYRNGGLFIDLEVLKPKHPAVLEEAHGTTSTLVVEWRALTVILLDRLADRVRAKLGLSPQALPLAKILEGGTWSAGRKIAREKRPDGSPPLQLLSDGTVF